MLPGAGGPNQDAGGHGCSRTAITFRPMPTRKGMHLIEGSTDGLAVLLYDAGRLDELRRDGIAAFVDATAGRDPDDADRKRLDDIARRGLVVEYELQGDGPVRLEVAVGPPLSAAEKKGGRWLKDQTALLTLPTGRLCFDWGDVEEELGLAPSQLEVPPGEYVLTLHRRDPDAGSGDRADVVTLSRAGEQAPPAEPTPFLSFGDAAGWPKAPPPGKVTGNVFQGTFYSAPARALTDAYRREVQDLELRFGSRLAVTFGGKTLHAIHIGRLRLLGVSRVIGMGALDSLPDPRPELRASLELETVFRRECLFLTADPGSTPFPAMKPDEPRIPITLTVLPDPYIAPVDPGLATRRSIEGGEIRTAVLACHDGAVIVGAGEDDLARIKVKPGDALTLRFPSGERTAHYAIDKGRKEEIVEALNPLTDDDRKQLATMDDRLSDLGYQIVTERSDPVRVEQIRQQILQVQGEMAAVRLPTPETLQTAPLEASPWHHWEQQGVRVLYCSPIVADRTFVDVPVGTEVTITKAGGKGKKATGAKAAPSRKKR